MTLRLTYSSIIFLLLFSTSHNYASGELVYSQNGMVVSASQIASEVGVDILKQGGNAIDAAVATGFALAVTYPSAGNIGGGGFMVININGHNTTIDFRETAPFASTQKMLLDEEGNYDTKKSLHEWTSVGIPGSVAGLIYALEKYGTMNLREVIQPAIDLAENGFVLDYWLTESINKFHSSFCSIESSKNIFTDNGDSLKMNSLFVQKDLANTLKLIRDNGKDGFYKGIIADIFVEQSTKNNGLISYQDLENYKAIERDPIISNYKEYQIIGMPPPSAGGIGIAQTLAVLEKYNFTKEQWVSSGYIHTISEILKYVYADRAEYIGDNDFHEVPIDYLLSENHINDIYSKISETAIPSLEINNIHYFPSEKTETTHYSVIDKDGNAVSTTVSLNSSYGNKIVLDGAGFLLNNHMDDFTAKVGIENQFGIVGSEANKIAPGKRMLSSMSPTIVLNDDKPFLILGSPGGSTIITSVLQVILNVLEFNMNIRDAINAPRFHHQWLPDEIVFESYGMTEDVKLNLINRGHKLKEISILGRAEGILFDKHNNLYWGSSDKRGFGKAVGY